MAMRVTSPRFFSGSDRESSCGDVSILTGIIFPDAFCLDRVKETFRRQSVLRGIPGMSDLTCVRSDCLAILAALGLLRLTRTMIGLLVSPFGFLTLASNSGLSAGVVSGNRLETRVSNRVT